MTGSMVEIIARKRDGGELGGDEIDFFVAGVARGEIPDYQAAALLMAIFLRGMNSLELTRLTEAMIRSGDTVSLQEIAAPRIDKHSTGGVGDKVSFIVAPLLASLGVAVPMLAGRGLGHTGGTLDKLSSIPGMNLSLTAEQFRGTLAKVGMAISGQTERIAPADRRLYALRGATATVSSIPLIASSIMSKKLALESDAIVLDVKTGRGAFMRELQDSVELCRVMVAIGEGVGRKTVGLITDMEQPLGRSVGNALEIVEALECLKGRGPEDVMEVSFALGWQMLSLAGRSIAYADATAQFRAAIDSGKALETFRSFIRAQGGDNSVCDDYSLLPHADSLLELRAREGGFVFRIDAYEVGMAAIAAGAGRVCQEDAVDLAAGFIISCRTGDEVHPGDLLATIHASDPRAGRAALERLQAAISVSPEAPRRRPLVLFRVDKDGSRSWEEASKNG